MKAPRVALLTAGTVSALAAPALSELRIKRAVRPLTEQWQHIPIEPRHSTLLGLSFRPLQAEALGLDVRATLEALLAHPFQLIRLGAYWNRIETEPGRFSPDELDRQVDAAARAGKRIILCVGAVKSFGYPEFFVPPHHLPQPLREGRLVEPADHRSLLSAASAYISRLVERYRDHQSIVAWQVEHEAVDPLGVEHSWRLALDFVREEIQAVRAADATRPVALNGFLPTSLLVAAQQWWRTRDQGDSLSVAARLADIVGIDFYPRHALGSVGPWSAYLVGSMSPWHHWRRKHVFAQARRRGARLMVAEGQAEPWEAVTTPPNPSAGAMYSCLPEQVIENYNQCMRWNRDGDIGLYAYLFWGAEYWVLRQQGGDASYLRAFECVLEHA